MYTCASTKAGGLHGDGKTEMNGPKPTCEDRLLHGSEAGNDGAARCE